MGMMGAMLKNAKPPVKGVAGSAYLDNCTRSAEQTQEDAAKDALDELPLTILPLATASLKRARLRKNIRLESVIELFADQGTGSGQVDCKNLHIHYGWPEGPDHPDQKLIAALGYSTSYDVFSLRIALRDLGVSIEDFSALQLSDSKKAELTSYMKSFTAPLIRQIFGQSGVNVDDFDSLVGMFKNPNREEALRNLKLMAQQLNVELQEVPKFLEDYGDTFLSLAYFQEILDALIPRISKFRHELRALRGSYGLSRNALFMRGSGGLDLALSNIVSSITGRFDSFNTSSRNMWDNINAESFARTRRLISAHHTTVGGVLCGLQVKIKGWEEAFADFTIEQQQRRRSEFILTDMRAGIEQIEALENSARLIDPAPKGGAQGKLRTVALLGLALIEQLLSWYEAPVLLSLA